MKTNEIETYDPAEHGKRGGYSKPITPICERVEDAIEHAGETCSRSDRLVMHITSQSGKTGWQMWARRANARGAAHREDYEFTPSGRRAKKRRAGQGRLIVDRDQILGDQKVL